MNHYGYFGEEQSSNAKDATIAPSAPNGAANGAAPQEPTPEEIKELHQIVGYFSAQVQLMPPQDIDDETYDYCVQTANGMIELVKSHPSNGSAFSSYLEGIPFEHKLQTMIVLIENDDGTIDFEQQLGKTKEEILNCLHAASYKKMDVVDYPLKARSDGLTSMIAKHPVLSVGVALGLGYLFAKKM